MRRIPYLSYIINMSRLNITIIVAIIIEMINLCALLRPTFEFNHFNNILNYV